MPRAPVARKTIHHMDFEALVGVNREVVALTGETHGYTSADGQKLSELTREVEQRSDNQEFEDAVPEKAALLVFKVASGQYFHAGNKRTALVAGLVFLAKNGFRADITNADFVSIVDRAGIGAADLDDVYGAIRGITEKGATERKGWDGIVKAVVAANKDFLTRLAA